MVPKNAQISQTSCDRYYCLIYSSTPVFVFEIISYIQKAVALLDGSGRHSLVFGLELELPDYVKVISANASSPRERVRGLWADIIRLSSGSS